ncbi:hypothetical protein HRJ45_23520 [Vibrio coralliilyticus]|uniref:hypothetical protein n=1 Tax=Vibrio coralliilyticus TaxID=190893 RepID=UPI00155FEF0F|nr:hypothetical protein [Vibrio coralliilyticus]NRF27953.1 hypothetical protein [Vibrio coralliilyticus]NRF82085.1 hypothetical protein [Vibrio coralliilyticus]
MKTSTLFFSFLGVISTNVFANDISDDMDYKVTKDDPPITLCGDAINDSNMSNAADNCLKVVLGIKDNAYQKLFTSTPSVTLMDYMGYRIQNSADNTGRTYGYITTSEDQFGPVGHFARFRQDGAHATSDGTLGQLDRFCIDLRERNFLGNNDWRRARVEELVDLRQGNGNLYLYGWPTRIAYSSSTIHEEDPGDISLNTSWTVNLRADLVHGDQPHKSSNYASCVSEEGIRN